MNRRDFLTALFGVGCAAVANPSQAQTVRRKRLGYLSGGKQSSTGEFTIDIFKASLRDLGWRVNETIDIDELVREQVLLAVPERSLCQEDCKGLCPTCGADRNLKECGCESVEADPRWAALKNLRF